eukprot:TRINITY_DN10107_c0_g1_i2.p1 TRINITY_DN10107_c0_g1~~TRINITY_DN10107_c0_g1_i2.p1  ORF type:complete len:178 (-),score=58.59 TRINITY_DN10107_c0_g1_i2:422-955(-)
MADVDELLRKQAQKHGLAAYNPAVSSSEIMKEEQYKEARTEHLLEVEDQNGGFAGFRKASEEEEVVEGKLSLEEYGSVEDLTGLGIDTLKEQLQLRGMKCGGTVQERAKRLWECKNTKLMFLRATKPQLFKKPIGEKTNESESLNKDKSYRKRQLGPLMPGQKMRKNQKTLPKYHGD